jgi:hypothetical protein
MLLRLVVGDGRSSDRPALVRYQQLIDLFELEGEQAVEAIFQLQCVASG